MVQVIDYDILIDELRWDLVKKALRTIKNDQLPGNHYFYLSFLTENPDVKVSDRLLERYPHEMTIVLQYQFKNLIVGQNAISVILQFDGIEEHIEIPYTALTSFADPSTKFGLNFRAKKAPKQPQENKPQTADASKKREKADNVVMLDTFRK